MHQEQRQRTRDYLQRSGLDRALFTNFFSVKWLTGFNPPVQLGPNWFAGGPPVVWYEDGHFTLFVVDVHRAAAGDLDNDDDASVVSYLGYTIEEPLAGTRHLTDTFRATITAGGGSIGIEQADLTVPLLNVLLEKSGANPDFTVIDGALEPLRMIKTPEEMIKLRENFALTDLGHRVAREVVAAGQREIDVWTAMHNAIEREAGQRVPFGNDCVVSERENNIGGWPLDYPVQPNSAIILDLSTVLYGYWSDTCATYYADEPTPKQRQMHQTVLDALELGISLVKPGAVAKDIDQKIRQHISDAGFPPHPHHTGHSVGVSGHEGPRIAAYNDEVIEEGMVILLEPGTYVPGESGARVEDAMLVTADGAEVISKHDKGLP